MFFPGGVTRWQPAVQHACPLPVLPDAQDHVPRARARAVLQHLLPAASVRHGQVSDVAGQESGPSASTRAVLPTAAMWLEPNPPGPAFGIYADRSACSRTFWTSGAARSRRRRRPCPRTTPTASWASTRVRWPCSACGADSGGRAGGLTVRTSPSRHRENPRRVGHPQSLLQARQQVPPGQEPGRPRDV